MLPVIVASFRSGATCIILGGIYIILSVKIKGGPLPRYSPPTGRSRKMAMSQAVWLTTLMTMEPVRK